MTPVVMIILVALGNQYVDASESTPPKRVMRRDKKSMGTYSSSRSISPEGSSMEPALMENKDEKAGANETGPETEDLNEDLYEEEEAEELASDNAMQTKTRASVGFWRRRRGGCSLSCHSICVRGKQICQTSHNCRNVAFGGSCSNHDNYWCTSGIYWLAGGMSGCWDQIRQCVRNWNNCPSMLLSADQEDNTSTMQLPSNQDDAATKDENLEEALAGKRSC